MNKVKKTIISKDHILLEKHCGCKLHIFMTDQYEEPCKEHKNDKITNISRKRCKKAYH